MLRFTKDHEWISLQGKVATVGITDYAQTQLGDVVYVELPEVGARIEAGAQFAVVESVKAASEVYAPLSGTVKEINHALSDSPATVNESPESGGWFAKFELDDPAALSKLMDEAAYKAYVAELG
ncbi:MAG: glycine cleavage system protein GcvH [Hyphomicrobiales bacterium]|nr:glycine cleavage system protein GcvH [Hyphomicrobiales bacterium]